MVEMQRRWLTATCSSAGAAGRHFDGWLAASGSAVSRCHPARQRSEQLEAVDRRLRAGSRTCSAVGGRCYSD